MSGGRWCQASGAVARVSGTGRSQGARARRGGQARGGGRTRGLGAVSSGWCQRRWDGGSQFGVRHEGGGVVSDVGWGWRNTRRRRV
ncbi:MAG: hypothetical protein LBL06_01020 [Treponema sp.]|nr:hypothetical protein [Treponema sp.]